MWVITVMEVSWRPILARHSCCKLGCALQGPDANAQQTNAAGQIDALEAQTLALLAEVEAKGGSAKAIEAMFFQDEIGRSAYEYQLGIESGATVIVGVNKFADGQEPPIIPKPNFSQLETEQVARVRGVRAARDAKAVTAALDALKAAAPQVGTAEGGVMARVIDAVRARATVGEISDTLESVWGRYRPN